MLSYTIRIEQAVHKDIDTHFSGKETFTTIKYGYQQFSTQGVFDSVRSKNSSLSYIT